MTPPRPSDIQDSVPETGQLAAVLSCLIVLRQRADYLRAAQGRKAGTAGFLLQARSREDGDVAARVGFTASKKIGNAVFRNRAKRRMRALAREILAPDARPGWDYVLVAKPNATVSRDYALLQDDLRSAILLVHRDKTLVEKPRGGKQSEDRLTAGKLSDDHLPAENSAGAKAPVEPAQKTSGDRT